MKAFPRILRGVCLLVLVAIVWPGGSDVGMGMETGSARQKPLPPGSPQILSFTASPSRILKGDAATLRWEVAQAEHIWISRVERPDSADCVKQASGEMRVTPETDTTYKLHAWGRSLHILREVTVQVTGPSGFCAISGQITNDKQEYATTVGLYLFESTTPAFSTQVDPSGRYGFPRVPEGTYRVIPKGKYPSGQLAIGPIPPSERLSCQPNGSHRANFRIGSREGDD